MRPLTNSHTRTGREKLRFGLVGAGAIAQTYLQAFEHCAEARLVAVTDIRLEAAQRAAERMGCDSYERIGQMIRDCTLDAAIVCTPPATHAEICIELVQQKIHVLCEKPFSIDRESAQQMVEAARTNGVKLTMASKYRYVDDVIRARSIVSSGALGDLILFENSFAQRIDVSTRWNRRPEISGGGVLIDNGTHSVDLMHYFLGPLAELQAREGKRSSGSVVEETVALFARSVGGVMCNVNLSWAVSKQKESFLDIYGTLGAVSVGWKKSARLDFSHHEWVPLGNGYNKIQAFRKQIENFARAMRGEESLLITAEDAIDSVNIVECAYQSLRQKQGIQIETYSQSYPRQEKPQFTVDSLSREDLTLH